MERGADAGAQGAPRKPPWLLLLGFAVACGVTAFPFTALPAQQAGEDAGGADLQGEEAPRTIADMGRGSAPRGSGGDGAPPEVESFASQYMRVLGWLVVVVALAVGSVHLLKRFHPGAPRRGGRDLIEVLGRASVTPKHQLVAVRVAEKVLVLGAAPERLSLIAEMRDPREVIGALQGGRFEEELAHSGAQYDEEPTAAHAEEGAPVEPYRREIDRLRRMVANWRLSTARVERT